MVRRADRRGAIIGTAGFDRATKVRLVETTRDRDRALDLKIFKLPQKPLMMPGWMVRVFPLPPVLIGRGTCACDSNSFATARTWLRNHSWAGSAVIRACQIITYLKPTSSRGALTTRTSALFSSLRASRLGVVRIMLLCATARAAGRK